MSSFFALCKGETKKIWAKKSAWIMGVVLVGIVALVTLLFGALGDIGEQVAGMTSGGGLMSQVGSLTGVEVTGDLYLKQAEENMERIEEQLKDAKEQMDDSEGVERFVNFTAYNALQREYQIAAYRVEHQLAPEKLPATWNFIQLLGSIIISVITLFALITGAGSVASEYSDGTIKLLVPRPYRRWKLLLAKILATFGYTLMLLVFGYLLALLSGGILYGFQGAGAVVVGSTGIGAYKTTAMGQSLLIYLSGVAGLLVTVSLSFMISCLIRSRAAAVGVSLLVYLVSSTIMGVLVMFGVDWVKYTIFFNMDLSYYLLTGPMMPGTSILFSAVAMAIYMAAFFVVSFISFCKRDI